MEEDDRESLTNYVLEECVYAYTRLHLYIWIYDLFTLVLRHILVCHTPQDVEIDPPSADELIVTLFCGRSPKQPKQ